MEPFEISLTFIWVLGRKKNGMGIFFRLHWGEKFKIKQHCQMFACLFIDFFRISFWYVFSKQDFQGFSQTIYVFIYLFICCPLCHFSLTSTRDSRLVFVFFGMAKLSSLSPPHWAKISALWRQVNVTKHGALCSTAMHHGLTADIKSALWSVCVLLLARAVVRLRWAYFPSQ